MAQHSNLDFFQVWGQSAIISFFPKLEKILILKANYGILNSSKKRSNKFVFTTMRLVFVRFSEEIEDTKKTFQNYLTFRLFGLLFP